MRSVHRLGYLSLSLLLVSCASRCHHEGRKNASVSTQKHIPLQPPESVNVDVIKASRDTCTSPCPVFFDAISNLSWDEIESSTFTWTFRDGKTADGFMAAHVFEQKTLRRDS